MFNQSTLGNSCLKLSPIVSAINAKTLEVTLNRTLNAEEEKKATFEVLVNGSKTLFKVEKYDGAKVQLVRSTGTVLEAGKYEVTVNGLEKVSTATTNVEAQKPTGLTVTTDKLLDDTNKAKVGIDLKDQYGTTLDIKQDDYTVTAYNTTQNKTVTVSKDATDKFFVDTKTNEDAFKVGDKINVTFIHNVTGLKATKELEVVSGAQLASVELGKVELPTGKTVLTEDLTNVKVPYVAKDQYGNATKLTLGNTGNAAIISSDESILNPNDIELITEDKAEKLKINKFGSKTGAVTLTIVNKVTGDTSKITLDVQQKAGAISGVSLEKTALDVAEKTSSQTVYVGLNVTDNYGNKIESKDFVGKASEFTINSSNNNVVSAPSIVTTAGANQGKLGLTIPTTAKKGDKATVTVTVNKTGETATLSVTIGEKAVPSSIVIDKDSKHTTSLATGASTTVKFDVQDQYGNTTSIGDYTAEYTTKNNDGVVELDTTNAPQIKVTGAKSGSAVLVAKLKNADGEVVASKELTFNVVANSSENLTYSVEQLPTLFKVGASNGGFEEGNIGVAGTHEGDYAKELKIIAKDANGNVINVNPNSIISVSSSDTGVVNASQDSTSGKWYVYGNTRTQDITEDKKEKLTVVYNAEDGVKNLTTDVTVSKADRQAKEIKFVDTALNASAADKAKAKAITSITSTSNVAANLLSSQEPYIWVEDQFGGYTLGESASDYGSGKNVEFKVVGSGDVSGVTNDTVNVSGSAYAVTLGAITDVNSDDVIGNDGKVRIIATASNGVAKSLDITVNTTDKAKPEITSTANYSSNKISVAASENLRTVTASDFTVEGSVAGDFGSDKVTLVPTTDYMVELKSNDAKVVEVTLTAAGKAKVVAGATTKFKVTAKNTVKDLVGNVVDSTKASATTAAVSSY